MRQLYRVYYGITTHESAEQGELEESGPIGDFPKLSDAVKEWRRTRTCAVDGVHAIEANRDFHGMTLTIVNGTEFETGAQEERTLCIPKITDSSARRLARSLGINYRERK